MLASGVFNMSHLEFVPFWRLYHFGFFLPKIRKGSDEYHNKSWYIIIFMVGSFIWFQTTKRNEVHVNYWSKLDGFDGVIYKDCDMCQEFVQWVEQESDLT